MRGLFTVLLITVIFSVNAQYIAGYDYDQPGTDNAEFIEVFLPTGTSASDYQILLYNGAGGALYSTILGSTLNCVSATGGQICTWDPAGSDALQNGAPDGIVLYNSNTSMIVQGISYEGDFTPINGPASGFDLSPVPVAENNNAPNFRTVYDPNTMTWLLLSPLPVKFSDISIKSTKDAKTISFSTLSEVNNDFFEIERSSNSRIFTSIGKLDGADNSSTLIEYTFIDEKPLNGVSYYKVKQVDHDGQYAYSNLVSTNTNNSGLFNITSRINTLSIITTTENYNVYIYNIAGQLLRSAMNLSSDQKIDLEGLEPGLLIVKTQHGQIVESHKINKF
jgi:hypothetical protein